MDTLLTRLTEIASTNDTRIEGNCYTIHNTADTHPALLAKRENLALFANNCTNIFEIGFNAGHSAAIFLSSNPNVHVTCVDIGLHSYVVPCYHLLRELFGERIHLYISDSKEIINIFGKEYYKSFDGVHVDGNHGDFYYVYDTFSVLRYMKDTCLFIMDDTHEHSIQSWVNILRNTSVFKKSPVEFKESTLYKHEILMFKRPRYAICTLAKGEGYCEKVKHCLHSKYRYARHYGYTLLTDNGFELGGKLGPGWYKIYQMKKYINEYDYLFWFDADAMIMNDNICLDSFFLTFPSQKEILISKDVNGMNSGVMLVKNSTVVRTVLENLDKMNPKYLYSGIYEQLPLIVLEEVSIYPNLYHFINQNIWNSYDNDIWRREIADFDGYKEGDFIVHFAGYNCSNEEGKSLKGADEKFAKKSHIFSFPFDRFLKEFL